MIQALNYMISFLAMVVGVAFLAFIIMWCCSLLAEILDDSRH